MDQVNYVEDAVVINVVKAVGSSLTEDIWIEDQRLTMEIDSRACTSVISEEIYNKMFSHVLLKNVLTKFVSVTGENLEIVGKLVLNVKLNTHVKGYKLELFIIKSEKHMMSLLEQILAIVLYSKWRDVLQSKSVIGKLSTVVNKPEKVLKMIRTKYPSVLCELPNQVINSYRAEIVIKSNTRPIFHKAYTVLYKLRDVVSIEIDRLVELGILKPDKFSEWQAL